MAGIGMFRAEVSSRTIRYSSGASRSVTGFERLAAIAMRSENQYIAKLNTSAMPRAIVAPDLPPISAPIPMNKPPRAAMRIQVLNRLIPVIVFRPPLRTRPSPGSNPAKVLPGCSPAGAGSLDTRGSVLTADRPGLLPFAPFQYPIGRDCPRPRRRSGDEESPENRARRAVATAGSGVAEQRGALGEPGEQVRVDPDGHDHQHTQEGERPDHAGD